MSVENVGQLLVCGEAEIIPAQDASITFVSAAANLLRAVGPEQEDSAEGAEGSLSARRCYRSEVIAELHRDHWVIFHYGKVILHRLFAGPNIGLNVRVAGDFAAMYA